MANAFVSLQGYPFQVGYCESDGIYPGTTLPQYTLYLVADSEKDRTEWISSIRKGNRAAFFIALSLPPRQASGAYTAGALVQLI